MAQAPIQPIPAIIHEIIRAPQQFSFTQIVRLLYMWVKPQNAQEFEAFLYDKLRFRANLSLGFAATDVTDVDISIQEIPPIKESEQTTEKTIEQSAKHLERTRITADFMGLYGASSPLPKAYTECLLDEQAEDISVLRDFFDMLTNRLFVLHAQIAARAYPLHRAIGDIDTVAEHMLMSLASFGHSSLYEDVPDKYIFLRYAGLFFQKTRTASGLRAIIADVCACPKTQIICNVPRMARISDDQRFRLGVNASTLGEDAVVGDAIPTFEGKIILALEGLDAQHFRNLLPTAKTLAPVVHSLIRNYCRQTLEYAVKISLLPNEVHAVCLGGTPQGQYACLGHDTWLGFSSVPAGLPLPEVCAQYPTGYTSVPTVV